MALGPSALHSPSTAIPSPRITIPNLEIMNALLPLITRKGVSKYRQHADRVFSWLETNKRELGPPGSASTKKKEYPIVGWSTDRILEPGRIDSWNTAAALHFLVFYRKLLQEDVNEHLAKNYDRKRPKMEWHNVIDAQLCRLYADRVTTKIYKQFIRPFKDTGASLRSAMILHGPPGTAKTTLAEAIATELEWDMFTITPSDFVKNGIENSEASARTLFREISQLREAVVFFDEIDEMLRDRQEEKSQGTVAMLRFLIPGMLPKLQSLKQYGEKNKLILIVATNYMDRLDTAITRTGRIDEKFAIVPPDLQARYCLLQKLLDSKKALFRSNPEVRELERITKELNDQNDLKQNVKDLIRENKSTGKERSRLVKKIKNIDKQIATLNKKKRTLEERTAKDVVKRINVLARCLSEKTAGWVYKELDLLVETLVGTKVHGDEVPEAKQKKLFNALRSKSFETIHNILRVEEHEDRKSSKFPKLCPYKICDREPALNLFRFYDRRSDRAKKEVREVLKSYVIPPGMGFKPRREKTPSAEFTDADVEAAMDAIFPKEEPSQEEIMAAFARAISKASGENQPSAPNSS
jgi:AAA+ superfamily predicted ATPase